MKTDPLSETLPSLMFIGTPGDGQSPKIQHFRVPHTIVRISKNIRQDSLSVS
jgi:hypothetical protein